MIKKLIGDKLYYEKKIRNKTKLFGLFVLYSSEGHLLLL